MSKGEKLHAEMVQARQNDGINVIFEDSLSNSGLRLSRSRSGSSSSRSSGSGRRGRGSYRGRYRSPSTSSSLSSSRSPSCPRSRSHPRCHRRSSRCHSHNRYGRGRYRRSPPRRYRAYSRSYSRSPSSNRSLCSRIYRPHFRSSRLKGRSRKLSQSPSTSYRSRSRSRSSRCSVRLTVDDKRELLKVAEANAKKLLSVDELELPESLKQILPEPPVKPKQVPTELRVRQDSESVSSQKCPCSSPYLLATAFVLQTARG
ncbi:arginine/serine-rich protein 1 isoform X3 [Thalassophryne amazonica]|uniref:arginine/serine-rich protein 1 isoform X3 n=1 Tax=Thalassophryne amazonica TaxID=390379 RepID=UPI00147222A0|nr:arginine/serine-rich protein 1 isoform X3 [Thalassophryne amazonica]